MILLIIAAACIITAQSFSAREQPAASDGELQRRIHNAMPYDTLIISGGEFIEFNVVIDKPLTLIGKNYPVLNADNKGEGFIIESDNVTIEGWKIIQTPVSDLNENAAIKIVQSKHVEVRNNKLAGNFFGIYLAKSDSCIIRDNTIQGSNTSENNSGNGVHLWKCDAITITGNSITGHRDAIYLEFVSNSKAEGNHCFGNIRYGLHFMFSNNDTYMHNVFSANGAGVAVMYSKGVHMEKNTFEKNMGNSAFGLLLKDITDSEIQQNNFDKNSVGIRMEGSSRIYALHNNFSENGWALIITANCTDVEFVKNNFELNSFDVSTNGSLVMNTFNGNYWDKYEGYDLNKDAIGDVPYHPVSLFAAIVDKVPESIILYRSFAQYLIDKAEKVLPGLTPENLVDNTPCMKPVDI